MLSFTWEYIMNSIHFEIIKYILESKNSISSNKLAYYFDISSRTIQNYIKEINIFYPNLIESNRNGYNIKNVMLAKELCSQENKRNIIPKTNTERYKFILKKIIVSKYSNLKITTLMNDLFLSLPSIKKIISFTNKELKNLNLSLEIDGNDIKLKGYETDKRKLFSLLIFEESDDDVFQIENLNEFFSDYDLYTCKKIITYAMDKHNYFTNEFGYKNLMIHLCIFLSRLRFNSKLKDTSILNSIDSNYVSLLKGINDIIHKKYSIFLNDYELEALYTIFKSNDRSNKNGEHIEKEYKNLCIHLIESIEKVYNINLNTNDFLNFFIAHINSLLFRLKHNKNLMNPFYESIRMNSPLIYDIATFMAFNFKKLTNYELDQNEIGFFALHIGAEMERQKLQNFKIKTVFLYSHYLDIKKNTFEKIKHIFSKELEIKQEIHEESDFVPLNIDLIISDRKYPKNKLNNIPVIYIDSFSQENYIDSIFKKIKEIKNNKQNEILLNNFDTFFKKELFFIDEYIENHFDAINMLCDEMYKQNYISSKFKNYIYQREKLSSTAFNNFAIPHQFIEKTKKSSIAILINKNGIQWNNQKVKVVFLFNIALKHKYLFKEIYSSLIDVLNDSTHIDTISTLSDFLEFKNYLLTLLK